MRYVGLALLMVPLAAYGQQQPMPPPETQALQATVMDQVQALIKAHAQEAMLAAQVNELQRQLEAAKKAGSDKPAAKP